MDYNKIETIVLVVLSLYSFIIALDFIVYVFKSAPKASVFPVKFWALGFITTVMVISWLFLK